MKIKIKLVIILLVFLFTISPISFSVILNYSQAVDSEEIISDQEWTTDKTIDKNIIIKPGVTVIIRKGVVLTFNNASIDVLGNMIVSGTLKNPVIFRKAQDSLSYGITVPQGGSLIMRNADVSGSGILLFQVQNKTIENTAYAVNNGGIQMTGGVLNVQGSNFHDNGAAIYINRDSTGKVIVNRTKFSNNSLMDVGFTGKTSSDSVNFKYNWWGSADGPPQICETYNQHEYCFYDKFDGNIDFSDWLTREDFHDPVILIPGILGSQEKDGKWHLDLTFHTYDNLYNEFVNNGYVPDKDIFKFPYNWRDSNVDNAKLLRDKINEIKQQNNWPKVDIVAHSMGGLLAREYIESGYYQNDVDQLITLGTPQNGAPEAYLKWEGDVWSLALSDIYAEHILTQEAKENGYDSIFNYVHERPVASLKELLPIYEYMQDVDSEHAFNIYPIGYPRNEFLENLNNAINKQKLNLVEFDKIIGNTGSSSGTISGFKVIQANMGEKWTHGYPFTFENLLGDRGIFRTNGDRTVPLESAKSENISSDTYIELNSKHVHLPTEAQKDVLELLTAKRPEKESRIPLIVSMLIMQVYSPIDIQIISPSGKKYGKNFENNKDFESINGSFYTGFDTKNEFLTIPNPEDGEYEILTQGTGDGEYHIEVAKISENPNDHQNANKSAVTIAGNAILNNIQEAGVEVNGNNVSQKNLNVILPTTIATTSESDSDDDSDDDNNQGNRSNHKKQDKKTSDDVSIGGDVQPILISAKISDSFIPERSNIFNNQKGVEFDKKEKMVDNIIDRRKNNDLIDEEILVSLVVLLVVILISVLRNGFFKKFKF